MGLEDLHLGVFITARCNKRCAHCSVANILVKTTDHTADLDITAFRKALLSLETKVEKIIIAGGEPTLHPDFKKFVLFASRFAKSVQIDTNLTTFPQTEQEIAQHLNWLPPNATFMVGFDRYHYPILNPEFELKLLNFIKYCIKTKRRLIVNSVAPKIELPGIRNRELAEILTKLYNDAHSEGTEFEQGYLFWEKADRTGNAKSLPKEDTRAMTPAKLHKKLIGQKSLLIFPNAQVYTDENATLFPLNPENIFYRGDLKKEQLINIFERQMHKAVTEFGRVPDPKKAEAAQKQIDEMSRTEESPAFIRYLRHMSDYKKQKQLRENTLKRLRNLLRRK